MNNLIEEMKNLNSENYQEFISKYGKIQDVELAKNCLVLNPNAWNVLHDDLKQMGEVIAHYIPIGYYSDAVWIDVACCEMYELEYFDVLVPEGFTCDKDSVVPKIIPNITWPEDFSKEQYLQILSNIPNIDVDTISSYWYVVERKTHDAFKNTKMRSIYNINHDENKEPGRYPDKIDRTCMVFDRSKIKGAIDNFYNNLGNSKTKK